MPLPRFCTCSNSFSANVQPMLLAGHESDFSYNPYALTCTKHVRRKHCNKSDSSRRPCHRQNVYCTGGSGNVLTRPGPGCLRSGASQGHVYGVVALARHDTNAYIRTLGNIASERVTDGKLNIDVEKFEDGKSAIGSLYCDVRAAVEEHALHIHPLELPYLDPSVVASINPSGAEGIASLQQKAYHR
ncbi:hypothetical protein BC832DRAFT_68601 [Gaertneriomyces semiglobifer]|nr:hypothetical protein BC832DRAFT_68601 [Gaertneriomyces semiglobifer]